MTPDRWQQIKAILDRVLAADPSERDAVINDACRADAALHGEVRSLLQHDAGTGDVLNRPLIERLQMMSVEGPDVPGTDDLDLEELHPGTRLGPYRIERSIGHGGMGSVYLASRADGEFVQQVAIKIIQRGMSTAVVLRRFRGERQILAAFNQPNIARLLDGGTAPDGRPYLVMEWVDGPPIDRYCDERHLSTRARLELFQHVCDAVQYAHRRLVVHRDLKPSNILVAADGAPRLLDFGIAKLLGPDDEDTPVLTAANMRMMTPAYAAPEQLNGEPVTTATDVYALGKLLSELLTGSRAEPSTETSAQSLGSELDAIVQMAMRTEPERRYGSAEQLSADIGRYLDGQPVVAQPDSWRYRTGKFFKRNRTAVVAASVVLVSIVGGSGAALWQARVAKIERLRAERRFADVQALAHALIFDIHDEIDKGPLKTRQLLVTRAMTYLDRLTDDAGNDVPLQHELASAYQRLASIQGTGLTAGQLGDATAAKLSYDKARALQMRVLAAVPGDFESRREIAHLDWLDGFSSMSEGKTQLALEQLHRSAAALEKLRGEWPTDDKTPEYLMEAYYGMVLAYGSDVVAGVGNEPANARFLKDGLALAEHLVAEQPANAYRASSLASFYGRQADFEQSLSHWDASRKVREQGLEIRERLLAQNPQSALLQRELAASLGNFGTLDIATHNYAAMLEHKLRVLSIFQRLADQEPDNLNALQDLGVGERNLGRALTLNERAAEAVPHFDKALKIFDALGAKKGDDAFVAHQIAFTHLVVSANVNALNGPAAAIEEVRKGMPICDRLIAINPKNASALRTFAQIVTEAAVYSRLRAENGPPALWQDAKQWYTRSRDAWAVLQKTTGSLNAADAKQLETAEKGIAEADAKSKTPG